VNKPVLSKEDREKKQLERREKQRHTNVLRAEKMHRLRLADQAQDDLFETTGRQETSRYHIGCSGWFYWEWKNIFYPESLPTREWFSWYAQHFQTVEINASFYSWPTVTTVRNWVKQAGDRDFLYTVKVCELITHTKKLEDTHTLVEDFAYIAQVLGPCMGCFLFQLPPTYSFTRSRLKNILEQLQNGHRNVVEFRHASWWNTEVYEAFRTAKIIFCSCSAPDLPDELVKTADEIYIRFHGKKAWYRHHYSQDELKLWADRIKDAGAQTGWIYFNNTFDAHAIENSRELARLLNNQ
jgi:uncharacterized protein YecE (DUF72 family)